MVSYLLHFPNADSAVFFADRALDLKSKLLGENSHEFLNAVSFVAYDLETNFELATAKKYYYRMLSIRKNLYGERSREITATLDSIIGLKAPKDIADIRLYLYGNTDTVYRYAQLEALVDETSEKDIWNALIYTNAMKDRALAEFGDTSYQFIKGLHQLAYVLQYAFEDSAAAFYCLKKGLQILEENKKAQSQNYSATLLKLAEAYSADGDHANAIRLSHTQLLLISALDGEDNPGYFQSLTAIGRRYRDSKYPVKDAYQKSVQYLSQAINKTEKYYGKNSNEYAYSLLVLGGTCITWGKLDSAALLYNATYRIYEKNKYKEIYTVCRQLYMTYAYQGELAKSNAWLKKCLAISITAGDTLEQDYLTDIHNLVLGYISLKDLKDAGIYLNRYESIILNNYKLHQYEYLTFLKLKASYFIESGNYKKVDSIVLFRLNILTDSSKYHQDRNSTYDEIENCYSQLAEAYIHQNKYAAAKLAAQSALLYMQKLNADSITHTRNYYLLARVYSLQSREDSAIYYYRLGLALSAKDGSEPDTDAMMNLASVYWKLNNTDTAEAMMAKACERIKNRMITQMAGFSEREKQQYNNLLQSSLYKYYSLQSNLKKTKPGSITSAYNFIIQTKGLLLNTTDYLSKSIKASGNKADKQLFEKLVEVRNKMALTWQDTKSLREKKNQLSDSLQALLYNIEQELSLNSTAYASFLKQNTISFADIQKSLQPHEAAIEFATFPYFNKTLFTDSVIYAAFIITKDKIEPDYVILPHNPNMQTLVSNQGVSGRGNVLLSTKTNTTAYRQLYNLLWQPLLPYLHNQQSLYIAADGILNKVAFACLQDSSQYLIDRYQLHFVSSTKDIMHQKETTLSAKPSIALFGGALFSAGTAKSKAEKPAWKYLPGTLSEINYISALLKNQWDVRQYSGAEASETNIKKLTGNFAPDILHIATHGFYFPEQNSTALLNNKSKGAYQFSNKSNPLTRTGLLFASANKTWDGIEIEEGEEDGVLTAFELANMDMSHTQLAVLSACETGMGDILNGEGVYGLQRAIKQAGISKTIVSLWPVPDKETSEMMQLFYLEISKGSGIALSFRIAQKNMRIKYPSAPALWGAFYLVE